MNRVEAICLAPAALPGRLVAPSATTARHRPASAHVVDGLVLRAAVHASGLLTSLTRGVIHAHPSTAQSCVTLPHLSWMIGYMYTAGRLPATQQQTLVETWFALWCKPAHCTQAMHSLEDEQALSHLHEKCSHNHASQRANNMPYICK